jgi:hypothetical protein
MRKIITAAALLFALGIPAAAPAASGTIHACVNKKSHVVTIKSKCRKAERALAWSIQGLGGRDGASVEGPAGAPSTVPGPAGSPSTVPGPAGAACLPSNPLCVGPAGQANNGSTAPTR